MSKEEDLNKSVESAKSTVSEQLAAVMSLKERNPKAFYGGLAVLLLPILILMFSGGSDAPKPAATGQSIKELAIGQKYVLKSPNTVGTEAKIRLVPVPGTLAAYDDTEDEDRNDTKDKVCQHMAQGTPVEVMEFSDAFNQKKMFVKVKVADGPCKDHDGWVLAIEVQ